ncbi:hypothetical protein CEXT_421671 [Caerostris extrusa]|uniref:Uncharacterized protein n=1 Tax=Caerostris extrusa TaxID=172846 RepID=A0AAV4WZI8_CAEEX|nr:hypothetical protein CEXT_421671 [Caerostris extrusa]
MASVCLHIKGLQFLLSHRRGFAIAAVKAATVRMPEGAVRGSLLGRLSEPQGLWAAGIPAIWCWAGLPLLDSDIVTVPVAASPCFLEFREDLSNLFEGHGMLTANDPLGNACNHIYYSFIMH